MQKCFLYIYAAHKLAVSIGMFILTIVYIMRNVHRDITYSKAHVVAYAHQL